MIRLLLLFESDPLQGIDDHIAVPGVARNQHR
jgi:hypothetical protein